MYSRMDGWPNDRNNPLVLAEAERLFCRILELIKTWAILSAFRLFEHLWYLLHAGECSIGSLPSLWFEMMILWSHLVYSHTILDSSFCDCFYSSAGLKEYEVRVSLVSVMDDVEIKYCFHSALHWMGSRLPSVMQLWENMQGILYNCASFSHAIQLSVYKVGEDSHEHKSSISMMGTQKCGENLVGFQHPTLYTKKRWRACRSEASQWWGVS